MHRCYPNHSAENWFFVKAALRETHEEIGVEPDSVEVWGRLKPVFTRTMTDTVVPIVGCIGYEALRTDCVNKGEQKVRHVHLEAELSPTVQIRIGRALVEVQMHAPWKQPWFHVQTLFSVPLEELCQSTGYTRFKSKRFEYTLPVFFSKKFTVLSARCSAIEPGLDLTTQFSSDKLFLWIMGYDSLESFCSSLQDAVFPIFTVSPFSISFFSPSLSSSISSGLQCILCMYVGLSLCLWSYILCSSLGFPQQLDHRRAWKRRRCQPLTGSTYYPNSSLPTFIATSSESLNH
ncbi:unnamed protein product [Haemonchus placei]|uniref:Nudix hydrolase domain-containing protein n=1 Tax=Haemonchus placei TaxID=6290 RepID=A0A0N4VTT6_HAEPC|nr:unnamed protein product [Haemonchus placei]